MNDTILHEEFIESEYTPEEIFEHLRGKKLKLLHELNEIEEAIELQKQKIKGNRP